VTVVRPERKYRDDVLAAVSVLLADRTDLGRLTMFGHPAFTVGGKMFACLYADGLALKLPEALAQTVLERPGASPFQPYGKTMRTWVLIVHADPGAYAGELRVIEEAIAFAASRPPSTRAPRKRRVSKQ
jgi:TfoX/Sxy family transcriptional regulator of competence genes